MRPSAAELAATLGLEPHPEGGFFRETYRSPVAVDTARGRRASSTAILFLVTAGSISRLHRLTSDELWVYQGGVPLEIVILAPGGELERPILGEPVMSAAGEGTARAPQVLVPAGCWQGARLAVGSPTPPERAWALVSCIVTPGFDFADFELGERAALQASFPQQAGLVTEFTEA